MGSAFEQNRLKPGDAGYRYDVRADFGSPTEGNDWDSEGDDSSVENDSADLLDFLREEKKRRSVSAAATVTVSVASTAPVTATAQPSRANAAVASVFSMTALESPPKRPGRRMPTLA